MDEIFKGETKVSTIMSIALTVTSEEIAGAKVIRNRIRGIPTEFDTDFYLARWWRAYNGDIKTVERRMHELFEHRRAIGYDLLDTKQFDSKIEFAKKTFERFSISTIHQEHYSGNVCVFIQRMSGVDLKEITKAIPLSYVVHSYLILLESFTRAILAREAVTGTPGAVVVIIDLDGLNVADFLNPMSASAKVARLALKVWADYFSETIIKVYIVNPPALLNVMWQVIRLVMDKRTQSRVTFVDKPSDLLNYLSEKVVPECYGGARRDDSGYADPPETACRRALRVTPQEYYDVDELWRCHGFERMPLKITTTSIKGKHTFEVKKKCERDGQSLVWHFMVNGDIEFEVVRIDGDSETVMWPKITLTTLKSPEQGAIICKCGEYRLRFINPSNTWLPLKVHYIAELNKI
uniref:CRAL-TRIO domain-containing protein n=1 Tax=Parascaris univalens TaxID=6257 RepID=A0A915C9N0_PARUN